MGRLEQIWIKRFRRGPMDATERASLVAGRGLVGNQEQGGPRQITIIDQERWAALTRALGASLSGASRRANLMVSGVELAHSRGRILRIGPCRIRIGGETRPCERMDEAFGGLRQAMERDWAGGVFAEALDSGEITVGDEAGWLDE